MRDRILLNQLQSLPLDAKILMTEQRIREWYDYFNGDVCVSFSGGKDSTVLAHIVHSMYPDVPLVFADTGLEYPEIRKFASRMGAEFVRPKMMFVDVITKYGYPLISKEVAEAIHFARRIIPKNAGSLETLERERESPCCARRRRELDGTRDDTEIIRWRVSGDELKSKDSRTTSRPHTQSVRTEPQSGEEQTSRTAFRNPRKNRMELQDTRPLARLQRVQTYPAGQTEAHGGRLTGTNGEENPSPG